MFTQLSLFDSAVVTDTSASFVPVSPSRRPAVASGRTAALSSAKPAPNRSAAAGSIACDGAASSGARGAQITADRTWDGQRRIDEVRPMGELAQLVLARYDLLISRRQQRDRLRRQQPRKSIRVLS